MVNGSDKIVLIASLYADIMVMQRYADQNPDDLQIRRFLRQDIDECERVIPEYIRSKLGLDIAELRKTYQRRKG